MLKHYEQETKNGLSLTHEIAEYKHLGHSTVYYVRTLLDGYELNFQIIWNKKELSEYLEKQALEIR